MYRNGASYEYERKNKIFAACDGAIASDIADALRHVFVCIRIQGGRGEGVF